jgi:uncharacterized protein (TIGR03437 family)
MRRFFPLAVALLSGLTAPAFAQWDTTGDGLLVGNYNFRESVWVTDTSANNALLRVTVRYGAINFDGVGGYVVLGSEWNSDTNSTVPYNLSNTYGISAGGYGFLNRSTDVLTRVYGLVSNGIFIGSSTESGVNNIFIAARQPTTPITTQSFNQNYTIAYTNLGTPNLGDIRDANFTLQPNGSGTLAAVQATGYIGGSQTATNQPLSGTYSFSNGIGTMNLTGGTTLISGTKLFYVANGGNLIFGGSTTGADMFVGLLTPTSAVPASVFNGTYFQAGIDVDRSMLPGGAAYLNSYYGSFGAVSSISSVVGHQRLQTAPYAAYEYTYADENRPLSSAGSYDDFLGMRHFVSLDGAVRVGFGVGTYLGINVALQAPTLTGSGVYLNPNGIVNAASYTPFTAGISPGEMLTLFGSNLAPGNFEDGTIPNSLGGVTVFINGIIAPIYIARPDGLAVLVPYGVQGSSIADVVVNNNGVFSNHVTAFIDITSPGAFAFPTPNGLGYVAARHTTRAPTYDVVTSADPARPGEYIAVFVTGLGPVNPPITTGAAGPVSPLSTTTSTIKATVGGVAAATNFAGIAPFLHGTYQINVQVPATAAAGDLFLEIQGPDALNSQIKIPVGGSPIGSAVSARAVSEPASTRKRPEPPHNSVSTRSGSTAGSDDSSSDK